MGDSITQGWAEQRQAVFASNGYIGRGISGQTTSQMVLRFHQDVIALKPAVVAILAGTNDVAENTGPMTDAQILDNLAAMAEMARAHGIKVVVGSVPPATYFSWRREIVPTARIRDLNPEDQGVGRRRAHRLRGLLVSDGAAGRRYEPDVRRRQRASERRGLRRDGANREGGDCRRTQGRPLAASRDDVVLRRRQTASGPRDVG